MEEQGAPLNNMEHVNQLQQSVAFLFLASKLFWVGSSREHQGTAGNSRDQQGTAGNNREEQETPGNSRKQEETARNSISLHNF